MKHEEKKNIWIKHKKTMAMYMSLGRKKWSKDTLKRNYINRNKVGKKKYFQKIHNKKWSVTFHLSLSRDAVRVLSLRSLVSAGV